MSKGAATLTNQYDFSSCDTLAKHFIRNVQINENKSKSNVAMRVKNFGIWKSYTWNECYEKVKYLALGFANLGFNRGDRAVIFGENLPEWYWAQLAVHSLGGVAVGVFTDCIPKEVKYYIEDSQSILAIAHDQEQVDKIIEIKNEVPALNRVIYWEDKGLWNYSEKYLLSFKEVIESGRKYEKKNPSFYIDSIRQGKGDDSGVICYTSGTTGNPKGAVLSQYWLTYVGNSLGQLDDWKDCTNYLSFIPPAWATEQLLGFGSWLMHDVIINFPEKPETVQENIRELGPDLIFYGARLWENVSRTIQAKIADASKIRRFLYAKGMQIALKKAELVMDKKPLGITSMAVNWMVFQCVLKQLRDRLGLSNVKVVYSAGGALSPEIIKYFLAIGIEIKLFYGTTEIGVISVPRKGDIRAETSGKITPWSKVSLSEEGEILIKSESLFTGYFNREEETKKKFKSGWFQTGDFGYLTDDGHLVVIDRMQDLKPLGTQGKKFSPQFIEVRMRFSPFVKDVMVVSAKNQEKVGALVNIDMENTGRFAETNGIPYTSFTDLSQRPEIINVIRDEIKRINKSLPAESRVKKFLNFPKELDADEAELTRTRKLRRDHVEATYSGMIAALFSKKNNFVFETIVTYRDGKSGTIKNDVFVNKVD